MSSKNNTIGSKKQVTLARFFTSMKQKNDPETDNITKNISAENTITGDHSGISPTATKKISNEDNLSSSPLSKVTVPVPPSKKLHKNDTSPIILYSDLCDLYQDIESTSSRLSITSKLTDFFNRVLEIDSNQLKIVTYLCINRLGPDYVSNLELGLGEGLLIKAIAESTGKKSAKIRSSYKDHGDLGMVASKARSNQPTMFKPKPMSCKEVFETLTKIATTTGTNSQTKKIGLIKKMLTNCSGNEAKFLIRSLESKLRIGLAEKTVLISLAQSLLKRELDNNNKSDSNNTSITVEEATDLIRESFCQVPNYEIIIDTCLEYGISNLSKFIKITPGIPLKPMLAKPTKSVSEVLDRFQGETFTCEYKYDGERAQVHLLADGSFRVYSRNSENMTERYPEIDLKKYIRDQDSMITLILDGEAVAYDVEQMKILPFQILSTRKRKDVDALKVKVRVCLFIFDCLLYNDEVLINKTLKERREVLHKVLKPVPGELQFANQIITTDIDEMQNYLDQSVQNSCEGLMVKVLDGKESHYEPSKRSRNWLKLKKDYLAGVGDSLDLCVMGAYHGRGKRTGGYGGFLLGCYNDDTGEYETCCKIGTGFSDEMLSKLYETLHPTEIEQPKSFYVFDNSAVPDVWFDPTMLFEVLTADLSLSPIYKAGINTLGKGISLRFPRFLKIRTDKNIEDATTSNQVIDFYQSQNHIQ
ncbi:DNA ligase (ATP) CDC9 SCDLUD_000235 [Saccharomycodes ludwigii]|uniref:DNA ligase (ATP) CDC9 n=1 Tax=Saccharomycodes ludwigii TaxID=36035 RepID=UPI001E852236|nr:hypothetical protein SCDLUD_000235 [Saccharomycodes ludwigii]KAH3902653.1 hypothetical protein SCDLUD_000235 [Saccharomycodes ludwigii]